MSNAQQSSSDAQDGEASSLPFVRPAELVVFDVDGTLHNTFAWWHRVVSKAVQAFAQLRGVHIPAPEQAMAEGVVGMADSEVWAPFLPADLKDEWVAFRDVVVPLEVAELHRGVDYLFPHVRELLLGLRESGVGTALASNCRSRYFAAVCDGQGLGAITDSQWCLDSQGVECKTDMLRQAWTVAGKPDHVVMVGDREPDFTAAQAMDWPFIWRRNDRCDLGAELSARDADWSGDPGHFRGLVGLPSN